MRNGGDLYGKLTPTDLRGVKEGASGVVFTAVRHRDSRERLRSGLTARPVWEGTPKSPHHMANVVLRPQVQMLENSLKVSAQLCFSFSRGSRTSKDQ